MANLLDRYGIKEVADVTFYHIGSDKKPDYPVLVLDTLKVTSIEQTAETAEARGGKGNAKLIVWDFGKEITVNIEDALFSPKSLSIMLADGLITTDTSTQTVKRSARVVATEAGKFPTVELDGNVIPTSNTTLKFYYATGTTNAMTAVSGSSEVEAGGVYYATWDQPVANNSKKIITIKPDSFPGTYYVMGS